MISKQVFFSICKYFVSSTVTTVRYPVACIVSSYSSSLPVCFISYFSTESTTCHTFSRCHCLWKVLSSGDWVISWYFFPSCRSWILSLLLYFLVTNLFVLSVQGGSWDWDNDFNIQCINRVQRSEITFHSYSWWTQTFLTCCGRGHS